MRQYNRSDRYTTRGESFFLSSQSLPGIFNFFQYFKERFCFDDAKLRTLKPKKGYTKL